MGEWAGLLHSCLSVRVSEREKYTEGEKQKIGGSEVSGFI